LSRVLTWSSTRLFRRQFNEKWNFPPRRPRLKPEDEGAIVERIGQLWEQNLNIAAIREALDDEGWELGDNEFARLRKKNGFRRRGENLGSYGRLEKRSAQTAGLDNDRTDVGALDAGTSDTLLTLPQQLPALPPDEQARRAQRLIQVQMESDRALLTKKRRRRIRGYGHLPADDPSMQPRYNSETTLDECKAFLHLTNEMYSTIRADYEKICLEMGIERKKTVMENGIWQASKDRLVRENVHLSAMLHPLQPNLEKKAIAIDVLCADVTKRMRDGKKRMTLADANNLIGLNPTASKALRRDWYDILEEDHYTTRLACGDEHWAELREKWYATSPVLQQAVMESHFNPLKMRAIDLICRDATKRFNDDKIRKDPTRKTYNQSVYGPGPGSCKANRRKETPNSANPAPKREGKPSNMSAANNFGLGNNLDPALAPLAIPAYFRLSPQSQLIGNHPRMWLGKLMARTVEAVHAAATSKAGAATVTRVQGIIKNQDETEDSYQIDRDDELDVYLEAAGDKSTFVVLLEGGYA